ncbi:MAG: MarR family transcriptional regulator [Acidimicrobiales bacterium]
MQNRKYQQTTTNAPAAPDLGEVMTATRALVGIAARSMSALRDDVTLPQYRVLVLLDGRGPLTMGALAEALAVNRSSVTRLCDTLVDKGLIRRGPAPDSRRSVQAQLSARGRSTVRQVMRRRTALVSEVLARLDPEQLTALRSGLRAFNEAAGELPDTAWELGWPEHREATEPR